MLLTANIYTGDLDGAKNQLEDAKNHVSSASLWDKPGWVRNSCFQLICNNY